MPIVDAYVELGHRLVTQRGTDEAQNLFDLADRYKMETLCVASVEAMRGDLQRGNAHVAELIRRSQRLRGYVTVNPNHLEGSVEEMQRYLTGEGFVGIILPPPSFAPPFDSWRTQELIKRARRYSLPFVTFVERPEDAQGLVTLVRSFSGLRFLMIPLSGCDWWAALKVIEDTTNIAVIVSGLLTERGIVEQAVGLLGERRVLFGSGMGRVHPACGLGMVQEAALTDRQRWMVLETNAKNWLGL